MQSESPITPKTPQHLCGHAQFSSTCEFLCNDYVQKEDGLCYLQAFPDRQDALSKLGRYPVVSQFFLEIYKLNQDRVPPFCIYGEGDVVHLTLEDGLVTNNFYAEMTCVGCNKSKSRPCSYYQTADKKCLKCKGNVSIVILPRSKLLKKRVGSLTLSSLSDSILQFGLTDPSNPNKYYTDPIMRNVAKATRDGNSITLTCGDAIARYSITDQKLRAMKHDYIGSRWQEDTDQKLSTLGIEGPDGNLTPDFVDPVSGIVIELSSNASNSIPSLVNSFKGKITKYQELVNKVQGKLGIVVVGSTKIVTNIQMTPQMVQEFCSRTQEVATLNSEINHLAGFDVFQSDLTEDIKLAHIIFSKIKMNPVDSPHFKLQEILQFQNEATSEDERIAVKILEKTILESKKQDSSDRSNLERYFNKFNESNSKLDRKRVCNIPMVLPDLSDNHTPHVGLSSSLPEELGALWNQSLSIKKQPEISDEEILNNAKNSKPQSMKHLNKKMSTFTARLTDDMKIQLALKGVGGKKYDKDPKRLVKELQDKKSFHPTCDTSDIEAFVGQKTLFHTQPCPDLSFLETVVQDSKNISTNGLQQDSLTIWKTINRYKLIQFSFFISYLFMELSYNYKHWTGQYNFIRKDLKSGISLLIYNPKGHMFVSFSIPKSNCTILETGRIGPELYDTGTHYISDFCSFNEPTLEHFIKAGPYMNSLFIHLQSVSETNPIEMSDYTRESLPHLLLLYLNNKTDSEELVTSQRYLFMKLLEDVPVSPWVFVDRFPDVLRSRLTVYYLWKTIKLMEYYETNKIIKLPVHTETMILYEYQNIKSIFSTENLTLSQKINEFYFGYVISKERGRGSDRMFKVLSKIIDQEFNFRDNVKNIFTTGENTPKFCTNVHMMKIITSRFRKVLSTRLGPNFKDRIKQDFYQEVAYTSFGKLATLKTTSRDHPQSFNSNLPDGQTSQQIFEILKKQNPEENKKRPKVMEGIINLVSQYKSYRGHNPNHIMELLPWCLDTLIEKGYFDSDCFAKPQHGGDREIHVLEIMARIVQYFVELVARVVCKYFPSETTVNPETKDLFVKQHYSNSKLKLNTFQTHSKSADASKWCQAHHSSHFAAMFASFCPDELTNFLVTALSLWPKKRLSFPLNLSASMIANYNNPSVSKLYNRFRSEHRLGTGIFTQKMGNKIEISSGMFQGILHTTSSLYHTMIQEVYKILVESLCSMRLGVNCYMSVIQGSDDSGAMLSIQGSLSKEQMRLVKTLLGWKEAISTHMSIYWNVCKSSIGTHDLIEYNSEWHSRHKVIKPTFRWISACLEMSVNERFIDRIRIFNNILSQCLEGGATTLECSVVQLNQCSLHYMMLGFLNQPTSKFFWSQLRTVNDPMLGFFPCDFDISAGVTGVEFQLYCLFKFTNYGKSIKSRLSTDAELSYVPDEIPSYMKTKDLQSVKLKFSNMNIYQSLLRRLPISTYEEAIQSVEQDPTILFGRHTSWAEDQPSLVLKVFNPSVKESISNVSPLLRMAAASAYIQTLPCMTIRGNIGKFSLIHSVEILRSKIEDINKPSENEIFPLSAEFNKVLMMIQNITQNSVMQDTILKKTSKVKLVVFEVESYDYPIIDMCKRQWFEIGNIPLSRRQFQDKWSMYMLQFHFLSSKPGIEGLKETCKNLQMSVVDCKSFLESLTNRTRTITLYDSSSKSRSLPHSLSRVYWPNTRIHYSVDDSTELLKLRSNIFSLVSYWCPNYKKEELIQHWIESSDVLSLNPHDVPSKGKKLKIFRDFLNGEPFVNLISRIIDLKQGCIGGFTSVQSGYGKNRRGTGVWNGQICGVNVEIEMGVLEDTGENVCSLIKIGTMLDSLMLSRNLKRLIDEFNCTISNQATSSLHMRQNGSFSHNPGRGTPIILDPSLKFSYVENLEKWKWNLEFTDFNLRLKVTETTGGILKRYTILSDVFNSSDWLESCSIDNPDTMMVKWSLGGLSSASELSNSVGKIIPGRRSEFGTLMNNMKEKRLKGLWNLECFRLAIISAFKLDLKKKIKNKMILDPNLMTDSEKQLASDFYNQVSSMNWDLDDSLDREISSWADEVERDPELLMHDISEKDDSNLSEIIRLMQFGSTSENYLAEGDEIRTMPNASRFFANLNLLSSATQQCGFVELIKKCSEDDRLLIPGILGKIISLVLRKFHIANEMEDMVDVADLETEVSILSGSIRSSADLATVNKNDILEKIDLIEALIKSASEPRLSAYMITLRKYQRLLSLKESEKELAAEYLVDYTKLMTKICSLVAEKNLEHHELISGVQNDVLRIQFLEVLIKSQTNAVFEELSDLEQIQVINSITNKTVSPTFLSLICNMYDTKLTLPDLIINPSGSYNVDMEYH